MTDDAAARGADADEPDALRRLTHRTIKGVTDDLERFRFNTAISKLQVLTNEMRVTLDGGGGALHAATVLAQMLAPFAPYAAEELWREVLGNGSSVHVSSWPSYDPSLAAEDTVTLIVQVDGKVRDKIEVASDASEDLCLERARSSEAARRAIGNRAIAKEIVRAPSSTQLSQ